MMHKVYSSRFISCYPLSLQPNDSLLLYCMKLENITVLKFFLAKYSQLIKLRNKLNQTILMQIIRKEKRHQNRNDLQQEMFELLLKASIASGIINARDNVSHFTVCLFVKLYLPSF